MLIVLLIVDSLRADAPGFAGGQGKTATLDQLARESTTFSHMVASGSWTVPSLLAMTTGVYPHRLGVCRWRHPFPARQPTLISAFQNAGFEVKVLTWNPRWVFGNFRPRGEPGDSQNISEVVQALSGARGRDRLVIIHHWWTHLPYVNERLPLGGWLRACEAAIDSLRHRPESMAPKFRRLYLESVRYFSEEILPRYVDAATAGGEKALLALTGDHGENWGEALPPGQRISHVYDLHGRWLCDETLRVPLLFWGECAGGKVPVKASRPEIVRGVDIAPTLAGLAGIPWPGTLPSFEGPTLIDRGISWDDQSIEQVGPGFKLDGPGPGPDGRGLEIDGQSIADNLLSGTPIPEREALTVSSHNTYEPDTYPDDGKKMWRTFGLRDPDRWFIWDGVEGTRTVRPAGYGKGPEQGAHSAHPEKTLTSGHSTPPSEGDLADLLQPGTILIPGIESFVHQISESGLIVFGGDTASSLGGQHPLRSAVESSAPGKEPAGSPALEEENAFLRLETEWARGLGSGHLIPQEYFPSTPWECASLAESADSTAARRAPSNTFSGQRRVEPQSGLEVSSSGASANDSLPEPDSDEELIRNKLKLLGYLG